ncbi:unnamed protein product [Larinioides sclopetarius]|uniref:Uncharacterized protein n=1 Tax=Larinioides sclopetarius TaxID=280406 RepID=A0AAV2B6J7_9ARAC
MTALLNELEHINNLNGSHSFQDFTTMPSHVNVRNPMSRMHPPHPRPTEYYDTSCTMHFQGTEENLYVEKHSVEKANTMETLGTRFSCIQFKREDSTSLRSNKYKSCSDQVIWAIQFLTVA